MSFFSWFASSARDTFPCLLSLESRLFALSYGSCSTVERRSSLFHNIMNHRPIMLYLTCNESILRLDTAGNTKVSRHGFEKGFVIFFEDCTTRCASIEIPYNAAVCCRFSLSSIDRLIDIHALAVGTNVLRRAFS